MDIASTRAKQAVPDDVYWQCSDIADELWDSKEYAGERRIAEIIPDNYEYVDHGLARAVIRTPDLDGYVIKIAKYGEDASSDGITQNTFESFIWQHFGDELPLVPVHAYNWSKQWIVMPEADRDAIGGEIGTAKQELMDFGLLNEDELISEKNFVVFDGDVLCCDYGCPELEPGASPTDLP